MKYKPPIFGRDFKDVVCLDLSAKNLEECRRRISSKSNKNLSLVRGDALDKDKFFKRRLEELRWNNFIRSKYKIMKNKQNIRCGFFEGDGRGMKGNMNVELISRMLDEARECIEKKDAMQASEKLYKASEESLKLLSAKFRLPEYEDAKKRGRWTTSLLFSAVRKLSEEVNPDIVNWWDHAWFLHVEGFHEARLNIEEVKFRLRFVEELVRIARKS